MSHSEKQPSQSSAFSRLQDRLHHAKELFETGGVDFPGVGGLLWITRKFGIKGTLLIFLLVGFPLGEYSILRSAVYSAVPKTIAGFGLKFEAEEWSLSLLKLQATARNVRLLGPSDEKPVFTASEVELHGSIGTLLRSLPDMVTLHVFGWHHPFNEIVVRHGELHLERSLTGYLNWNEFIESVPERLRKDAASGVYQIQGVRFEDFRVTYVENLPGGSGEGVIKTAQAQVKVDEIRGTFTDLMQPARSGDQPTNFKIQGRSADGVFEIAGKAAFFPSKSEAATEPESESDIRKVSFGSKSAKKAGLPFEMSVYLENIAAGALGRMVPTKTIVPAEGLIGGTVKIIRVSDDAKCEGDFIVKDVRFAPNPLVITDPVAVEAARKSLLSDPPYSGPAGLCTTPGSNPDPIAVPPPSEPKGTAPPFSSTMTRLTQMGTSNSSPGIKALVAYDQQTLRGETPQLTFKELSQALGEQAAERVVQSLGEKAGVSVPAGSGNALTKGVKGVGTGIKKIFGKGKK
jgi:hypothetical protein